MTGRAGRHLLQGFRKSLYQCAKLGLHCSMLTKVIKQYNEFLRDSQREEWAPAISCIPGFEVYTLATGICLSVAGVVLTQFNCRTASFVFWQSMSWVLKVIQDRGNSYIKESFPKCDYATVLKKCFSILCHVQLVTCNVWQPMFTPQVESAEWVSWAEIQFCTRLRRLRATWRKYPHRWSLLRAASLAKVAPLSGAHGSDKILNWCPSALIRFTDSKYQDLQRKVWNPLKSCTFAEAV